MAYGGTAKATLRVMPDIGRRLIDKGTDVRRTAKGELQILLNKVSSKNSKKQGRAL